MITEANNQECKDGQPTTHEPDYKFKYLCMLEESLTLQKQVNKLDRSLFEKELFILDLKKQLDESTNMVNELKFQLKKVLNERKQQQHKKSSTLNNSGSSKGNSHSDHFHQQVNVNSTHSTFEPNSVHNIGAPHDNTSPVPVSLSSTSKLNSTSDLNSVNTKTKNNDNCSNNSSKGKTLDELRSEIANLGQLRKYPTIAPAFPFQRGSTSSTNPYSLSTNNESLHRIGGSSLMSKSRRLSFPSSQDENQYPQQFVHGSQLSPRKGNSQMAPASVHTPSSQHSHSVLSPASSPIGTMGSNLVPSTSTSNYPYFGKQNCTPTHSSSHHPLPPSPQWNDSESSSTSSHVVTNAQFQSDYMSAMKRPAPPNLQKQHGSKRHANGPFHCGKCKKPIGKPFHIFAGRGIRICVAPDDSETADQNSPSSSGPTTNTAIDSTDDPGIIPSVTKVFESPERKIVPTSSSLASSLTAVCVTQSESTSMKCLTSNSAKDRCTPSPKVTTNQSFPIAIECDSKQRADHQSETQTSVMEEQIQSN